MLLPIFPCSQQTNNLHFFEPEEGRLKSFSSICFRKSEQRIVIAITITLSSFANKSRTNPVRFPEFIERYGGGTRESKSTKEFVSRRSGKSARDIGTVQLLKYMAETR